MNVLTGRFWRNVAEMLLPQIERLRAAAASPEQRDDPLERGLRHILARVAAELRKVMIDVLLDVLAQQCARVDGVVVIASFERRFSRRAVALIKQTAVLADR